MFILLFRGARRPALPTLPPVPLCSVDERVCVCACMKCGEERVCGSRIIHVHAHTVGVELQPPGCGRECDYYRGINVS